MADLLKLADRSWPLLGRVFGAHAALYKATGGGVGKRLPFTPPMLLLEHVGAKSGRRHTTPLVYMPDGDNFVLVAAKGGYPKNPGWVYNLRAAPETEIQVGPERIAVRAEEVGADERQRLWPKAIEYNPQWDRYQCRTERVIPLVILRPTGG